MQINCYAHNECASVQCKSLFSIPRIQVKATKEIYSENFDEKEHRPSHWIVKWTFDGSMEQGFAYKLSNGSYGMLFHNGIRMRLTSNKYVCNI